MESTLAYHRNVREVARAYLDELDEVPFGGVDADDDVLTRIADDLCDHLARVAFQLELEDDVEAEMCALAEEADGEVMVHMAAFREDVAEEAESIIEARLAYHPYLFGDEEWTQETKDAYVLI